MTTRYEFTSDPRDATYRALIAFFCERAAIGGVVVRPGIGLLPAGELVLEELSKLAIEDAARLEWPGTRLLGRHPARVLRFATIESAGILTDASDSLFEWRQPDLPEDLHFLREDESPLLTSISHEAEGFLDLTPAEETALFTRVPDLPRQLRLG